MKDSFTLIELLVVMIIMTVIMLIVVPKGTKMLDSFQKSVKKTQDLQKLSLEQSKAFLNSKEVDINISGQYYHISNKGILSE